MVVKIQGTCFSDPVLRVLQCNAGYFHFVSFATAVKFRESLLTDCHLSAIFLQTVKPQNHNTHNSNTGMQCDAITSTKNLRNSLQCWIFYFCLLWTSNEYHQAPLCSFPIKWRGLKIWMCIVRSAGPIFGRLCHLISPSSSTVITGRQILSKIPQMAFVESERDYKWELNSSRLSHKDDHIIVSCDRSSVRIDEQFYVPNAAGSFDTQPDATMSQQLL